jgi:hypothetical protein
MLKLKRQDETSRRDVTTRTPHARVGRRSETGQATVEFALILLPLLILVAGIVYFGIGLNYWLSMNKVANQGARWAAVNSWPPVCPRSTASGYSCAVSNATCAQINSSSPPKARLQDVLRCQSPNNAASTICFPGLGKSQSTAVRGDPVKIKLTSPYKFFFMSKFSVMLTATATMRLEQAPSLITGETLNVSGVCP